MTIQITMPALSPTMTEGKLAKWHVNEGDAVKAGQVYPWYAAAPYSYQSYARIYQEIADELTAAKKLG